MTGFGCAHSELNGFQVPHFSHQDHVRVLSQGCPQGVGKAAGVFIELPLVHQALVALVHELDRVLDGEDVFAARVIDVIEQSRQGGGFAGTRGACHQHHPTGTLAHLEHNRWQVELLHAGNRAAQSSQAGGIAPPLPVDVDPEAGNSLESVSTVKFPGLLKGLSLAVVQHRENQFVAVLLVEGIVRHRPQFSTEPPEGRLPCGDVKVAAATLHQLFHQIFDHQGHGVVLRGCDVARDSKDIPASFPAVRHRSLYTSLC